MSKAQQAKLWIWRWETTGEQEVLGYCYEYMRREDVLAHITVKRFHDPSLGRAVELRPLRTKVKGYLRSC